MKSILKIAEEFGVEKHVIEHVINHYGIYASAFEGNRKLFDDNAIEIIKKHKGIESYIFLAGTQKDYEIFESKMNNKSKKLL